MYLILFILGAFTWLFIRNFKDNDKTKHYYFIAWCMTLIYFLFCMFFTKKPQHYGITLIYFEPFVIFYCILSLKKIHRSLPILFLLLIFALNIPTYQKFIKNSSEENVFTERKFEAIKSIGLFTKSYNKNINLK